MILITMYTFQSHSILLSIQFCRNTPLCFIGTELNTKTCQCDGNSESTCPFGFAKIVKPNEQCACEKKTKPTCLSGFTLNNACTLCSNSCPSGSTLSVLCTQTAEPICPPGHIQQGCECVKQSVRQCSLGILSSNGCKCTISTPLCLGGLGCALNTEECRCTFRGGKWIVHTSQKLVNLYLLTLQHYANVFASLLACMLSIV